MMFDHHASVLVLLLDFAMCLQALFLFDLAIEMLHLLWTWRHSCANGVLKLYFL